MTANAFRRSPMTRAGILVAVLYPLILANIFMVGYGGILHRVGQMRMAIVNQDAGIGRQIVQGLVKSSPVQISLVSTVQNANHELNNRSVQLIMRIPPNLTNRIMSGHQGELHFTFNNSNPVIVKDIMGSVANGITQNVNAHVAQNVLPNVLNAARLPRGKTTTANRNLSQGTSQLASFLTQPIKSSFSNINATASFAQEMIPLMFLIGFYVGAMTLATNLEAAALQFPSSITKWRQFVVRSVVIMIASLVVSGVGTAMISVLSGPFASSFMKIWVFEWLVSASFMYVAQIWTLLFGPRGILANLLLLIIQLVASGAIVPPELLSAFFRGLRRALPGTYSVNGTFNLLFGGAGTSEDVVRLLYILMSAILLGAIVVFAKRDADTELNAQEYQHGDTGVQVENG